MATGFNSASVVVWEWTNDHGDWTAYKAHVSNFIEDSSVSPIISLGNIDRSLESLTVDIRRMIQISRNGVERPVRRELYEEDSAVAKGTDWQWRGDHARYNNKRTPIWHSYSMEVANFLEAAYTRSKTCRLDLDVNPINEPYIIDLARMEQINKTTGFARQVQRLTTNAKYHIVTKSQRMSQSWQQYLGSWPTSGSSSSYPSSGNSGTWSPSNNSGFSLSSNFFPGSSAASATSSNFSFAAPSSAYPNIPVSNNTFSKNYQQHQLSSADTMSLSSHNGRPKRVRVLRKDLTKGSSTNNASSSFAFSSASPSFNFANNSIAGQPVLDRTLGGTSSNSFSTWRSSPAQPLSASVTMAVPQDVQTFPSLASSKIYSAGYSIGGSTISVVDTAASAFSSILTASTSASTLSSFTVTNSATKSGARTIGSNYANAKRRKVMGNQASSIEQDDLTYIQKLTAKDVLSAYIRVVPKPPAKEDCIICFDNLLEASGYGQGNSYMVIQLVKCSHMFHMDCISAMYDSSSKNGCIQCPTCKMIYGVKYGNCPNGTMEYKVIDDELQGYSGCSTIQITYNIYNGIQSEVHPNPGCPYKVRGFPRLGYLPNNQEGEKVLKLLSIAWKRRLTFTVGTSVTTGEKDVVVWNEIHHKTDKTNERGHGYPDSNYLSNVTAELAAHGVTDDED